MIVYFEFEEKRRKAEVTWPKDKGSIIVHVTDRELEKALPADLFFDIGSTNKVSYIIENPDNTRLIELQDVIKRRLQELAGR